MDWERSLGVDADGFTSDCFDSLCVEEREELQQRQRESWAFLWQTFDIGLDDPDDYEVHLPPLTKADLMPRRPSTPSAGASLRSDEATEPQLDHLLTLTYDTKEIA